MRNTEILVSCFIYHKTLRHSEEIVLYRCLRSARQVSGSGVSETKVQDECADIIARNPGIEFVPGLTGVEVDHMAHVDTNWDTNRAGWPEKYLRSKRGLGYILVSFRLRLEQVTGLLERLEGPGFYPDPHLIAMGYNCYKVSKNSVIRVRVEEVVATSSL